jgi:hypothetical protein
MADNSSVRAYNSWWQVRSDTWSRLEETSGQLADTSLRDEPADGMAETIPRLLDGLAPIEQYWAFPGPEAGGEAARVCVRAALAPVTWVASVMAAWDFQGSSIVPPTAGNAGRAPPARATARSSSKWGR